jgi:hypothetical protein
MRPLYALRATRVRRSVRDGGPNTPASSSARLKGRCHSPCKVGIPTIDLPGRHDWIHLDVIAAQPHANPPRRSVRQRLSERGQSLVEFTLVLPLLLFLVVTLGDFGRVFAAGITLESAARAAAEAAAAEYLREPGAINSPPTVASGGYARVHSYAWRSVCDEASSLPNAAPAVGPAECSGLPTIVCVHDGADPNCSNVYNVGGSLPPGCTASAPGLRPTNTQAGGTETSRYVEVRVCYRFSTLLQLDIPFIGGTLSPLGGDFYLERTRSFTVADY